MNLEIKQGTLERAIEIAARTHAGQLDKGGAPYILHPLRVMLRVAPGVQQIVAVCMMWWRIARSRLKTWSGKGFLPR